MYSAENKFSFGICLVPILLLSPLAYKYGVIDLTASLGGVTLAVAGGSRICWRCSF